MNNFKTFGLKRKPHIVKTISFERQESIPTDTIPCRQEPSYNEGVSFFKGNPLCFAFIGIVILGIILGTLLAKYANSDLISSLDFIFMNNYRLRSETSFLHIFIACVASCASLVIICVLSALSMWGVIIIPLLCLFKGLGMGLASGYLFLIYQMNGFWFNLLIIMPGALLSALALVICSVHSQHFSSSVFLRCVPINRKPKYIFGVKTYFRKISKCFIIIVISAAVDATLNCLLSGFFEL